MIIEPSDANRVLLFDTTLRDGEQSPGISLDPAQKLQIARQLARLGVDIIEAGFPVASPGDFASVQAVARADLGPGVPVICAIARAEEADVEAAWLAVQDATRPRIHIFLSTSDIHLEHQLNATRERVVEMARSSVARARERCADVEFSPMDVTRSDAGFVAEVLDVALAEGATTINLPDTVGYTTPLEYHRLIRRLYALVPGLADVVVSTHCHDDLGLAVANSLAGLQAGARQVECAVNGIGERAGNAALEELIMLLDTRHDALGLHTGAVSTEIWRTSRLVSRLTGYPVQPNKAIVGRNAFAHESGVHQDGVLKERSTYQIIDALAVGAEHHGIVLGKHSGRRALRDALDQLGHHLPGDELDRLFRRFKVAAEARGAIGDADLEALVAELPGHAVAATAGD
jgi:2-isopropylmalate synthase